MARFIDYNALIAKLESVDIFATVHDDEHVILAVCMDCDATIAKAREAETNAATIHLTIVEHDCSTPAEIVVIDEMADLDRQLANVEVVAVDRAPAETSVQPASTPPARVLHISDRCDRCQAQAFVRVETPAGTVDFCGHDYYVAEPAILTAGYRVIDERDYINKKPSVGVAGGEQR